MARLVQFWITAGGCFLFSTMLLYSAMTVPTTATTAAPTALAFVFLGGLSARSGMAFWSLEKRLRDLERRLPPVADTPPAAP
jgi:hypothetical protein